MSKKALTCERTEGGVTRYQAAVADCVVKIDRVLKAIRRKQDRIDKLRERTRAKLAELKAAI